MSRHDGSLDTSFGTNASVDPHRFDAADGGGLDSALPGHEPDGVPTHRFTPGPTVSGGAARGCAGDAVGPLREIDGGESLACRMFDVVVR